MSCSIRKIIDAIASRNEDAAVSVMRAAESLGDEVLRQQLYRVIHRLNQDAAELRLVRDHLVLDDRQRA